VKVHWWLVFKSFTRISWVLSHKATLWLAGPQHALLHGIIPFHMQDSAFVFSLSFRRFLSA